MRIVNVVEQTEQFMREHVQGNNTRELNWNAKHKTQNARTMD